MISVLMSIYHADTFESFKEAAESVMCCLSDDDEIVFVFDGKVSADIDRYVSSLKDEYGSAVVKKVKLEKNRGLAVALNEGLKVCEKKYIARMDADDISLPSRLRLQLDFLQKNPEIALVGGAVLEFFPNGETQLKKGAKTEEIKEYSKLRNPINHPTVMFRREAVMEVGGYNEALYYAQDYELWCRLISQGYQLANMEEVVLLFRMGENFYTKRTGVRYVVTEIRLLKCMSRLDYFNVWDGCIFILVRLLPRLLPSFLVGKVYKRLRG